MGAGQSNLSATGDSNGNRNVNDGNAIALEQRFGFQILRVHPNSPSSETTLYPCFDYIIAVNGVEVVRKRDNYSQRTRYITMLPLFAISALRHFPLFFPSLFHSSPLHV
jgi:hypothetical protein